MDLKKYCAGLKSGRIIDIIPSLTAEHQKKSQNLSKQAGFSVFFAFHDK